MKFIKQKIPEVILIKPEINTDNRGYFLETFRQDLFEKAVGYHINFIQDNESKSFKGVLRGLHYQLPPYAQSKIVKVIKGNILDVAVDLRKSSTTFGQHVAIELSDKNKYQLFIPQGFAHGFVVLSDNAVFSYKVDNYYMPKYERGIAFNDAQLNIDWKLNSENITLSNKDQLLPRLFDSIELFK